MLGLFNDPFFGYSGFPMFGFNRNELRMMNKIRDLFEEDSEDDESDDNEKEENKNNKEKNQEKDKTKSYQKYSEIRRNYINGPNMIEEVRERTCDGQTGTVKETTTRRIGDKWCTIEEETNKNGEKITREKWHNVSNDEVDKFKNKWEKHKGSFGFEHLSLEGPKDNKDDKKNKEESTK